MLKQLVRHIPALFTALVWGSTFVASKSVLMAGVEPQLLMTFRFVLAYCLLWCFCRKRQKIRFTKQEVQFAFLGIMGSTVYFLLEYLALQRTSAVNVGLINATVPIVSVAIAAAIGRSKPSRYFIIGSPLALLGAAIVILNGQFSIDIVPVGDLLAIGATFLWAAYTVVLSMVEKDSNPLFVTRRLFFYALISILPYTIYTTDLTQIALFAQPQVFLPAAYLGVFASALCIFLWNISIRQIGLGTTNNYLYLLPVVTVATSAVFAKGEITVYNLIGSVLICASLIIADRK